MADENGFAHHRPAMSIEQLVRSAIVFTVVAETSAPYAWWRSRLHKRLAPAA